MHHNVITYFFAILSSSWHFVSRASLSWTKFWTCSSSFLTFATKCRFWFSICKVRASCTPALGALGRGKDVEAERAEDVSPFIENPFGGGGKWELSSGWDDKFSSLESDRENDCGGWNLARGLKELERSSRETGLSTSGVNVGCSEIYSRAKKKRNLRVNHHIINK